MQDAISSLAYSEEGYLQLAADGVLRSYDGSENVIDYARLSNEQIRAHITNLSPVFSNVTEHLNETLWNVNGLDVIDEAQLTNPPGWLRRPPPQTINPGIDVKRAIQGRQWEACPGMLCIGTLQCQASGCDYCQFWNGEYLGMCILVSVMN